MKKKYIKIKKGLILINKPKNCTSNNVLQIVKKILHIKKAGYAGTLDPIATGILPIMLGKTTKKNDILINKKKTYIVNMKLGVTSNTYDKDGYIIKIKNINFKKITYTTIKKKIKKYTGSIIQKVPMYSAVKYNGKRLYSIARKKYL